MSGHSVDQEAFADVKDLDERVVFVDAFVYGLVLQRIQADTLEKVVDRIVAVNVLVVVRAHFDFAYI